MQESIKGLRKTGQFDDQRTYFEALSWRKWLQTLNVEILRFAQDDNVSTFSAACKAAAISRQFRHG